MLGFPSATAVEMPGPMGFDWVLLDNEHGSAGVASSGDLIRAAELTSVAPIVRPVATRAEVICPFLELNFPARR